MEITPASLTSNMAASGPRMANVRGPLPVAATVTRVPVFVPSATDPIVGQAAVLSAGGTVMAANASASK